MGRCSAGCATGSKESEEPKLPDDTDIPAANDASTPLDAEIATKTTSRDLAKTTLESTKKSLQKANQTVSEAQDANAAAKTDMAAKEAIAEARRIKDVDQAGGAIKKSEQDASTGARLAANNARDEVTRTQGEVDDALGEQGRLAALQTQHTADLDSAENSLQTVKDAAAASASSASSVVTTGGDAAGGDAAGGGAAGSGAAEEIGDGWEVVAPLSAEDGAAATAAVSAANYSEKGMALATASSAEGDWNPIGLVITAGLAIGTLFAGIFGHHRDGLPKHPPNAPPVMNASTQFGVAQ